MNVYYVTGVPAKDKSPVLSVTNNRGEHTETKIQRGATKTE